MKKRFINTGCLIVLLALIIMILKVEFFPFGFPTEKDLPNTSISIYNKGITIKNKNDFILFLKNNTEKYNLEAFKDSYNYIDWNKVNKSIETGNILWRKCYILEYTPKGCNMYLIKITSNGHIYDYRSCGK